MTDKACVVLFSGGMNSSVVLAQALSDFDYVHALSFYYGQKNVLELNAANAVMSHYGNIHLAKNLMHETQYINNIYTEPEPYPYIDGIMLSIAAAFAQGVGAEAIWSGHQSLVQGGTRDLVTNFISAQAEAIKVGTFGQVKFNATLDYMNKTEVIKLALLRGVPLRLTRSCLIDKPVSCGECDKCLERLAAFKELEKEDVIEYASK